MRTIENDVPEILLELAREAFALGLGKITLGFMNMDAEFVSPIEWSLWLSKLESPRDSTQRSYINPITMQRGDDEATSYVASITDDWRDSRYMKVDEIREWMREPLEAEGEYTPAWSPVINTELQARLLEQWELFEAGVRGGWVMERKVDWNDHAIWDRIARKNGDQYPADFLPAHKLEWTAHNNFYNYRGHESHRSTGAEVSIGGWSRLDYNQEQKFYRHDGGRITPLTPEYVHELLHANAPWFVRVAKFDEDQDEWFHYPEALKKTKVTIQE